MTLRPALIAALLVVAACNGEEDPTVTDALTTPVSTTSIITTTTDRGNTVTSTTGSTSTAVAPSTTATTTTTAPSVDDWTTIVQQLGQRRQDLYASPDVASISEVCADGSQCAQQLEVQIGDLTEKGWRVDGADPFVVLDARLERFDGDSVETSLLVTVLAVIERQENAGSIVDSSDAVVAAVEVDTSPGFNAQGRFLLGRVGPSDDPWRIVSQDELPEVPA